MRHPNSHLLPSPQICRHCLFKHRSCQGREWMRRVCSSRGYNLLLWRKRTAQKDTDSCSDFLFYHPSRLQPKAFTVYCEFETLWVISHLCALLMNSTAANQGGEKGVWDLWLLHLAYTCISGTCAKCIQIMLSSLQIGTTGIACIVWKMYLIDFYQGQSSSVRHWKGYVLPPYAE